MFSAASVPAAEAALACGNHELPPLFCSVPRAFLREHVHTTYTYTHGFNGAIVFSIGIPELIHLSPSKCVSTRVLTQDGVSTTRFVELRERDRYARKSMRVPEQAASVKKMIRHQRGEATEHGAESIYKEPNAVAKGGGRRERETLK